MSKETQIVAAGRFLVAGADDAPEGIIEYKLESLKKWTYLGSNEKYQNQEILKEFCWPVQAKEQLVAVLAERTRLKKEWDDSMKLVYELNNAIARGEVM